MNLEPLSQKLEDLFQNFNVDLKEDEKIVLKSKPSIIGLIAGYLTLPAFLLIYFILFKLPQIIRKAIVNAVVDEITGGSSGDGILSRVLDTISGAVIVALIILWIVICVVVTIRYFGYRLVITNIRVVGKARVNRMDVKLTDVMNVYIEQSIWGKLLGYGHITVRTKRQALTFKNISNPQDFYRKLMDYASEYFAY